MSHSVVVNLIADQILFIRGQEINIHDLESITLDAGGCIIAIRLKEDKNNNLGNQSTELFCDGE